MSGPKLHWPKRLLSALCAVLLVGIGVIAARRALYSDTRATTAANTQPILVGADYSFEWTQGDERLLVLRGHARLHQAPVTATAEQMVVRISRSGRLTRLRAYLEDNARIDQPDRTISRSSLVIEMSTEGELNFEIRRRLEDHRAVDDPLFRRAMAQMRVVERSQLHETQWVVPPAPDADAPAGPQLLPAPTTNLRRIRILPRNFSIGFNVESFRSETTTPPEQVLVLTRGVNVLIDNVDTLGTIDLSADNVVIWTQADLAGALNDESLQSRDIPLQVYLEGNIVIRQSTTGEAIPGEHVLRANRAFYDAQEDRGLLLDAELRSYIPQLGGELRIRAERLRQLSRDAYHAQNGWFTTSPFGKPGYRLQMGDVFLERRNLPGWAGQVFDPATGLPQPHSTAWVTSLDNVFYLRDAPLLYLPKITGPAEDPGIPLRRITLHQNRVFGGQIETDWDAFKLFGIDAPAGVRWTLDLDEYTARGPAAGTSLSYQGSDWWLVPGSYNGEGLFYYIHDDGDDNLGRDRRALAPEDKDRWRIRLQHRQDLPAGMTLFGEIGILSDRNFLEQYFENEFDEDKDQETLLYLKQSADQVAWTFLVRPQTNDFENTTEWLPRSDLYVLSHPLFGGAITWSTHSSIGFGKLRRADAPTDPTDLFTPLPFIANADGAVAMSRHEVTVPVDLGPIRIVPYVMGEVAFWDEGFAGNDVDRFFGRSGVRSSITFWKVMPHVQSRIFNLNGLAHKMTFEADYAWTDSDTNLAAIPQYNEFDDNAQERFRQRFLVNTFGGVLPPVFAPRFYAVRTGAGATVTAPYHELIEDQQVLRLGWRHRLQTKVGPLEHLRVRDWMTLDLGLSYFPDPARDNFGEEFGLFNARYRWDFSDRTALQANAYYDFFDNAQQIWNVALLSQRATRGSIYLGIRQVKGAGLDSQILTASYSYAMSPKWISTAGTAFDLAEGENRGQSLTITRVGADFLIHFGASYDRSKNNAGVALSVEPRLAPPVGAPTRLGSLLGIRPTGLR